MKKYRLKTEAVKFFQEKYATKVLDFADWQKIGVDENALEEVGQAHIVYGHESQRGSGDQAYKTSSLSGWGDDSSRFHFTIHFPSVKFMEHDKFANGKVVRELMNKFQRSIDSFYQDFTNNELNDE